MSDQPLLKLPEAFKLNLETFDDEHEEIVEILNTLLSSSPATNAEYLVQQFDRLRASMKSHFAHEEAYMLDMEFPGLEHHRQHHNVALERTDMILEQCYSRGNADFVDITKLFGNVILDIVRADLVFKEFVNAADLSKRFVDA